MIAPLMPFAIKGVIWYQGEADTANTPQAGRYATLLQAMIKDWRAQWKQGDFPFIFVQLPTSEPQYPDPTDSA
jgi:sialate O-acetylesterase